jgi:hypothetical protein
MNISVTVIAKTNRQHSPEGPWQLFRFMLKISEEQEPIFIFQARPSPQDTGTMLLQAFNTCKGSTQCSSEYKFALK